jgi:CDP-paratose 2-epimerase
LRATHGGRRLTHVQADIRDATAVADAVARVDVVYHLAAQVAVTTSVAEPRYDFEVNALGAFNVLEGARLAGHKPTLVFTSTNKVYGGMEDIVIVEEQTCYRYRDYPRGIAEDRPLDFHSPYGCSKGAADQYMRDYARIYDLPTIVFRMSCIYGPRQFGTEDQGWVAYFVIASLLRWPITVYGDGKQVRDILFIDDLVRAFDLATEHVEVTAGQVYNIGGGPDNTIAIWQEFGGVLRDLIGREIPVNYDDWRPGDQLVYVSDTRKARREFGWQPQIGKLDGVRRLLCWVENNLDLFVA